MMRVLLTAISLLLYPLALGAQNVDVREREAIYTRVAEFADSVIAREVNAPVRRQDIRVSSLDPQDRPVIERMAATWGARVGWVEDVLVCKAVPDGRDCHTSDGSRGGFRILGTSFNGPGATIAVETWYLFEFRGRAGLAGQIDELHFSRTASGWRLDRVERHGEMSG